MIDIAHGQRLDLPGLIHNVRIRGQNQAAFAELAPILLPLIATKLSPEFPPIYCGENRPGFTFLAGQGVDIDLGQVPADITNLQLVLYGLSGPSRVIGMDRVGQIETIIDSQYRFRLDLNNRRESALILVDFYRRSEAWRLAATGQGFTTGIPGLMRIHGITLDVPYADNRLDEYEDEPSDQGPRPGSGATGSGFAVAPRLVMTNHHVIEQARLITVTGENTSAISTPASVIAIDPINDIALLALNHDAVAFAAFRNDHDVDLGEDVTVAGFPLQGLLGSGPQISAGNISALTGVRGDAALLQFNSPIGSGSSGGPMLDASGHVIGLVTAALNQNNPVSIAQNINFGVKGSLLRSFLHASGVRPSIGTHMPISRADIARRARQFLYRINVEY
ncbi:MAG: trypsin-like peptidase domain-containing protein [Sphingomonadales bacterium]|jgi:S1-C subfamily serine protease